jgi:hypothetical protein
LGAKQAQDTKRSDKSYRPNGRSIFFFFFEMVFVKVIILSLNQITERFEDALLIDFLKSVVLVSCSEYFFCAGSRHFIV